MDSTNPTLLERVRNPDDQSSWRCFYDRYAPLIRRYGRTQGLRPAEADDLVQDCMTTLARSMRAFAYDPSKGRFKSYLYRMVNHRVINLRRRKGVRGAKTGELTNQPAPDDSEPSWNRLWMQAHVRQCLSALSSRHDERTLEIFKAYTIDQIPSKEVAERFGMEPNAVHQIKNRVLASLKREMQRTLGEEL